MTQLLVVDDDQPLRRWECRVLEAQQYTCIEAADAEQARAALRGEDFELALLDVNLPGESGIELLSHIRARHPGTAVLMVTGEDNLDLATTAIELGAFGYVVKPVRAGELLINVVNSLHRRRRETELMRRLDTLQTSREELEQELRIALYDGRSKLDPEAAELLESDTVHRLVRMAEFRDEQTGHHLVRMGRYCEAIGQQLGLDEAWCAQLRLSSELHDIGKVAIPDRILLKPGRLTSDERRIMRRHTEVGHRLLCDASSQLMRTAATIALSHHERWDGDGYPQGRSGTEIPTEGRIAAVADVFDALTSDRVYRPAFPVGMATEMMQAERGRHFDPEILDAMLAGFGRIDAIRQTFSDP